MNKKEFKTGRRVFMWLFAALLAAVCAFASVKKVDAAVSTVSLSLDDSYVSGEISTEGEVDYYKVTLTKAGWLTVTFQVWDLYCGYCEVWSDDMSEKYDDIYVSDASSTNPKTDDMTLAMEPGTYLLKISGYYSSYVGDYRVKASFEAAGNNEKTDNDEFGTAQTLAFGNKVTGFLSEDDRVDFYKIQLSSKKTIRLIYTSYFNSYMAIYDEDYLSVECEGAFGSKTSPESYEYEATLAPGTYYIKIYPDYGSGKYIIQYKEKVTVNSIKISGKTSIVSGKTTTLTATVSPTNATVKTVKWTSGDTNVATIGETTGKVTAKRPGVVKITALAQDGSNKQKVYTLIVKPKKETNVSVKSYNKKQLYVTYAAQYGCSGYQIQYAKNKKFKNAKSKKTTSTSVTIKKLKRKKKYYVRVRSYVKNNGKYYYGAWSTVKTKKVK